MNIDKLTIGDLKQIKQLFSTTDDANAPHPFTGRYVLCRCFSAGVHAGELVALQGDQAILRNSRRLWRWKAVRGVALSGVAQYGVVAGSKLDVPNPAIVLIGVIEVIPCTDIARSSIDEYESE